MSINTPEFNRDRFTTNAMSRTFHRMAGKAQQFMQWMQAMAESMRACASSSMTKGSSRSPMTPQAGTCMEVAFALNRPYRRGLRNSKSDFYFKDGR